ncbi:MAG: DUF3667 domain-containing protein [Rubrivivax sp.]|nr:DUF3667 domain-containing protein [Rubrivivax sp.]
MPLLSPVPSPAVAAITAAAVLGQCPNCETQLPDPHPRYCHACGQETNIKPPTVGEFLQQFSGTYFAAEGAMWRTFKLLLTQPGELTARYLNGQRKQYVLPLRLFLSITLVMLLTMRILGAIQLSALDDPELAKALSERPTQVSLDLGFMRAGLDAGVFYCEGMAPWLCRRIQVKLDTSTAALLQQVQRVNDRIASYAGVVMFVLLPGFALGLAALFRYRGFSYTEHLVFALHLHAFWFMLGTLVMVGLTWFEPLVWMAVLVIPVYAALAFRRVYGGSAWRLAWRAVLLMLAHLTLVVLLVALTALVALLL